MSRSQMISALAPTAKPTPGPLLVVKRALEGLSDIDFGTPEYAEATQAAFEVAQAQRSRVLHGSRDSMVLASVILGLYRFLSVDWTQPGIETLLASGEAFGYNPDQARAPRGTRIGGQWIDTPSKLLKVLNTMRRTSPMDMTQEEVDSIPLLASEMSRTIENYYTFGTEDARKIFDGSDETFLSRTYGQNEFTVDVEVKNFGSTMSIHGIVRSRWGHEAGHFTRAIYRDAETGEMVVNHEHLELHGPFRRQGFGTAFSKQSEEMYADLGITRINVTAGLTDGGLAWARAGYVQDPADPYIDFHNGGMPKLDDFLMEYEGKEGDEATFDFLMGLHLGRDDPDTGFVNLESTGYTIDDVLSFHDANGYPVGEELLRGSLWRGVKYIEPSAYSQSVPVPEPALAASGRGTSWAESKERADMLWEFCFSTGAEYTDDDWTTEQANAWRALDADGRARWNNALMASGFNPEQVRAPRGTPIGGRWIDSPTGLLMELTEAGPKRAWINPGPHQSKIMQALAPIPPENLASLAETTRRGLQAARDAGVHVSLSPHALMQVAEDGRMKNLQEVISGGGVDAQRATRKVLHAEQYVAERGYYNTEVLGIPPATPEGDLPIFGWGNRSGEQDTLVFGTMVVRLKPEVNERTSWTVGDSFHDYVPPIMSDDIDSASQETLIQASDWSGTDAMYGPIGQVDFNWSVPYVEAQVHGGVSVSDIAAVIMSPDIPLSPEAQQAIAALSAQGVSIEEGYGPTRYIPAESGPGSKGPGAMDWDLAAHTDSFAFNPNQARAPRGTPRGGQWIETPTGLLRLVQKLGPTGEGRSEPGTDVPGLVLNRKAPIDEKYFAAWEGMDPVERETLAYTTQDALREAIDEGVTISVWPNVLENVVREGRFHTMRDRLADTSEGYDRAGVYQVAREQYERDIMGVPENLADDQRPIYGWGSRYSPGDTFGYGNIEVKLREEVNDRTTWTIGDSLNLQSRPLWTAEALSEETSVDEFLAASHWAISGTYTPDGGIEAAHGWEFGPWDNGVPYVEAQVYGGITLRDIESVTMPSRNDFDEETIQALESAGVEIIAYDGY